MYNENTMAAVNRVLTTNKHFNKYQLKALEIAKNIMHEYNMFERNEDFNEEEEYDELEDDDF